MTFNEYQKNVISTASPVCLAAKENMRMNGIIGAAESSGELLGLLKKQLFHDCQFDRTHCIESCGDVLYYLAMVAESMGTTLEEIADASNNRLLVGKTLNAKGGDV